MGESSTSGGLLAELRAAPPRRLGCSFCEWVATQPEKSEWSEAFADPSISTVAIWRAAQRRGFPAKSENAVSAHRRGHESH